MQFYRHMATNADLALQREFLQESRLMKVVLKSKRNLASPREDQEAGTGHVQQRLANSLTPIPNKDDDDLIV